MPERPKDLLAVAAHGRHPYIDAVPAVQSPSSGNTASHVTNLPTSASSPTARRARGMRATAATATKTNALKKHDESPSPEHALIESRLIAARGTRKLDLSLSGRQVLSGAAYQLFPRQVLVHEQLGYHLIELWLTNHRIAALPPQIALCASLRVLALGGNLLSSLPDALGDMESLEALYLERNCFRVIPASTTLPFRLRDLRLDSNQLVVFPSAVTKLRLLNRLGLSCNQICAVPPEIWRLRNLVELDLDHNALGPTLPHELAALTKLERLGLDGNCLADGVQQWVVTHLSAVTYLRINGNRAAATGSSDGSGNDDEAAAAVSGGGQGCKDPSKGARGVPLRHDGYFQCTQSYRRHTETASDGREPDADAEADEASHREHRLGALAGLVPCREQNIVNGELYRTALARCMHRKAV